MSNIDTTCVNAIRVLAADAIQKAKSGHPGLPLGSAAMAYELWGNHMNHNAKNPQWANRGHLRDAQSGQAAAPAAAALTGASGPGFGRPR